MALRIVAGCRAVLFWTLPWSLIFTAITQASLVDRLEAFLKEGALSQSLFGCSLFFECLVIVLV